MLFQSEMFKPRTLNTDELLYSEGQPGDAAFFVISGRIGLTRTVDGRVVHLGTVGAGSLLGERELLAMSRRSDTATVLEPSSVSVLDQAKFADRLGEADAVLRDLITALSDSLHAEREAHMVKPRSLGDTLAIIRHMSEQLRQYANRAELIVDGPQFGAMLTLLETAITRLEPLVVRQKDRRTGVIPRGAALR